MGRHFSCYKLFDEKLDWKDAETHCQLEGGHLVSIRSTEENQFVTKFVKMDTWIGANDFNSEGDWEWSDGSTWDYSDWNPGNPNHDHLSMLSVRHCGIIETSYNKKWEDENCNQVINFICRKIIL